MMGPLWTTLTGGNRALPARTAATIVSRYDHSMQIHRITSWTTYFVQLNVRLFVKKEPNLTLGSTEKKKHLH